MPEGRSNSDIADWLEEIFTDCGSDADLKLSGSATVLILIIILFLNQQLGVLLSSSFRYKQIRIIRENKIYIYQVFWRLFMKFCENGRKRNSTRSSYPAGSNNVTGLHPRENPCNEKEDPIDRF